MELMTGYYRQKEDSTALLLQQYVCRGVPVCLGCICGGEGREAGIAGGLFTGGLLEEFRRFRLLKAVEKREKFLGKMERQLYESRERCGAFGDFWTAGILCIGERFLLFSEGAARIVLCNAGFGRPAMQEIMGGGIMGGSGAGRSDMGEGGMGRGAMGEDGMGGSDMGRGGMGEGGMGGSDMGRGAMRGGGMGGSGMGRGDMERDTMGGGNIGRDGRERRQLQTKWGSMEMEIGILLASESFFGAVPREDMQNCLWVKNIRDSRQTQKRVQELGRAARRRNDREMGALLLEVRQSDG